MSTAGQVEGHRVGPAVLRFQGTQGDVEAKEKTLWGGTVAEPHSDEHRSGLPLPHKNIYGVQWRVVSAHHAINDDSAEEKPDRPVGILCCHIDFLPVGLFLRGSHLTMNSQRLLTITIWTMLYASN